MSKNLFIMVTTSLVHIFLFLGIWTYLFSKLS